MSEPKKRGRPELPKELKRGNRLEISLTPAERARLDEEAAREGVSLSELIRRRALVVVA